MIDDLSGLNLQEDFGTALAVPDAARWKLEKPGPLEVWCVMAPKDSPDERFQARLVWREYSGHPPSLKFRDPASGRLDLPSAWPKVRGFRPESLDACVSWTVEGMNLHPEWRTDQRYRWDPRGNRLLFVLRTLQDELDYHFGGRHP
jgi:hypothetical protein